MKKLLRSSRSILDVGCGELSPIRFIKGHKSGVDGYAPSLKLAKKNNTHDKFFLIDIKKIKQKFQKKSFDAVVAIDVIEHLKKQEGYNLIKDMESLASKIIIFYTPNGFIPQHDSKNKLQEHLSGWTVNDFHKCGYTVKGMYGHKSLRGDFHKLKYKPTFFWLITSELSSYFYTFNHPESAASLLAYKRFKQ